MYQRPLRWVHLFPSLRAQSEPMEICPKVTELGLVPVVQLPAHHPYPPRLMPTEPALPQTEPAAESVQATTLREAAKQQASGLARQARAGCA
jgi:hypothetical protein